MCKPAGKLLGLVCCSGRAALLFVGVLVGAVAIVGGNPRQTKSTFASDLEFLRKHTELVILGSAPGPQVVVAPGYEGRVMTSTTGGHDAPGFGWIGHAAIESGNGSRT